MVAATSAGTMESVSRRRGTHLVISIINGSSRMMHRVQVFVRRRGGSGSLYASHLVSIHTYAHTGHSGSLTYTMERYKRPKTARECVVDFHKPSTCMVYETIHSIMALRHQQARTAALNAFQTTLHLPYGWDVAEIPMHGGLRGRYMSPCASACRLISLSRVRTSLCMFV